ncbi:hypothetical protein U9M48_011401 [Paspalum notatum var. saurae]|uniref:DUF4220 domain-containing protein n=1 Tax=Paspalum notatum var. saurae TaxID=547442 RepID=A0AAQ3WHJ9_PASNO
MEMANNMIYDLCFLNLRHTNGTSNTTLLQHVNDLWNSPRGKVIYVEALVVLAATILLFLTIFGSWRRRSRNFFIQKGVLGAYTLSFSLVSYTLGLMQFSPVKSNMYSIWAMSLYALFSCADSITAYSLDDNNESMRQVYLYVLYHAYVLMIFSSGIDSVLPIIYLSTVVYQKFMHRLLASQLATLSWNLNKMVADYMYKEHIKSGSSYNPASMNGYNYLVDWPLHKSTLHAGTSYATLLTANAAEVIDLERCGESSYQKTHDFVFKGLLSRNADGTIDYNRIFKVVDVELAFMYDFFFTKYAVLYYGSKSSMFWSLASSSLISVTAYLTISNINRVAIFCNLNGSTVQDTRKDPATMVITVMILLSIALLQLLHYCFIGRPFGAEYPLFVNMFENKQ